MVGAPVGNLARHMREHKLSIKNLGLYLQLHKRLTVNYNELCKYCRASSPEFGKPNIWDAIWESLEELGLGNREELEKIAYVPSEVERWKRKSGNK